MPPDPPEREAPTAHLMNGEPDAALQPLRGGSDFRRRRVIGLGHRFEPDDVVALVVGLGEREVDEVVRANGGTRVVFAGEVREVRRPDAPFEAIQQLVRNALIHRVYEGTNAPVRFSWFRDRLEILAPGGPFGQVTLETFAAARAQMSRTVASWKTRAAKTSPAASRSRSRVATAGAFGVVKG